MMQRVETYPPEVEAYRQLLQAIRERFEREGQREIAARCRRGPMISARERNEILQRTLENVKPIIDEQVRLMPLAKVSWFIDGDGSSGSLRDVGG